MITPANTLSDEDLMASLARNRLIPSEYISAVTNDDPYERDAALRLIKEEIDKGNELYKYLAARPEADRKTMVTIEKDTDPVDITVEDMIWDYEIICEVMKRSFPFAAVLGFSGMSP